MRKLVIAALVLAVIVAIPVTGAIGQQQSRFHATLNSASEVPRTNSPATGRAALAIARNGRSIAYRLQATGLTGPPMAAHIHLGRPGQAGGVMITLSGQQFALPLQGRATAAQFTATGNVKTFRQALKAIRAGRTYVNIHTARYPAGEIRGQVRAGR
jgi:hypothetical protein